MNEQPARNTLPSAARKTAMATPTQQALWDGRGLSFFGLHKGSIKLQSQSTPNDNLNPFKLCSTRLP
jgi:hypothetical protein